MWLVCHCGLLILFVTHGYMPLSRWKDADNRRGMPFQLRGLLILPISVCLDSPCFHMCPVARLPLAEQLWFRSPWPPFKEAGWHIVSSHFVLGVVSNGLWKDGSHLSPYCIWRMATCLHFCSDGPRPLFASAEWNVQLPKRRAGPRTVLLLFLPAQYNYMMQQSSGQSSACSSI